MPKVTDFTVKGLVTAPCTPFTETGEINLEIIYDYVNHLVEYGVPNVFILGTTGEGNNMTVTERKRVAETWVKAAKGKLQAVIVQIGAGCLKDSQELASHAESIGADAISCVGTTYYKPRDLENYVEYMKAVAAMAPKTPFFLYDIDFVTGIKLQASDFFAVAHGHIPTLRGVKHTSAVFDSMHTIMRDYGDRYQLMMGTDALYLEGMVIGADVTIMNSYLGHVLNRMRDAYYRGDCETARMEQGRALAVCNIRRKLDLSISGGTKAILELLGLHVGSSRLPVGPESSSKMLALKKELQDIGFFEWGVKR